MSQFDIYENPLSRMRPIYPLVVVLQSDRVDYAHGRIAAPLASSSGREKPEGRLAPIVAIEGEHFVVLIPEMAPLPPNVLRRARGNLSAYRQQILAAIDCLFLGF